LFFTAWSTSDFVQHLDRQVHSIHCSFIPGLAAADVSGTSGCHVALMSPYSSVFRSAVWGGIPATLAGMAVFAYLLYRGVRLVLEDQQLDRARTRYLVAATLLPVLTSLVYGYIALVELDALCKLCMGIYLSSFTAFGAAIAMARAASAEPDDEAEAEAQRNLSGIVITGIGEGTGFVLLAVALYVAHAPDFSDTVGKCGELTRPDDTAKVMVPLGPQGAGPSPSRCSTRSALPAPASRIACRRPASPAAQPQGRSSSRSTTCNWMVSQRHPPRRLHVSEAVLCAGDKADAVLAVVLRAPGGDPHRLAADPDAAKKMVTGRLPRARHAAWARTRSRSASTARCAGRSPTSCRCSPRSSTSTARSCATKTPTSASTGPSPACSPVPMSSEGTHDEPHAATHPRSASPS
jgi:uncharacterized membrane protein